MSFVMVDGIQTTLSVILQFVLKCYTKSYCNINLYKSTILCYTNSYCKSAIFNINLYKSIKCTNNQVFNKECTTTASTSNHKDTSSVYNLYYIFVCYSSVSSFIKA